MSNTVKNTIRELVAALGQLLDQVDQLKDLCPDDDALRLAIDDAEQALELAAYRGPTTNPGAHRLAGSAQARRGDA